MAINDVTGAVLDAALKVHSALGPGLLESAYAACLAYELKREGSKSPRSLSFLSSTMRSGSNWATESTCWWNVRLLLS